MNKRIIFVLIVFITIFTLLVGVSSAGWFTGSDSLTTKSGTVITVPDHDVKLLNYKDGVETYGFKEGDAFYYAIVLNYSENSNLYGELVGTIHKGKIFEENGIYFYEQEYQELGNSFNVWTGEQLVLKDKTVDGASDTNVHTGEAIFVISSNYLYVVDTMKDIDWSS